MPYVAQHSTAAACWAAGFFAIVSGLMFLLKASQQHVAVVAR
jgi:hypothetical protein